MKNKPALLLMTSRSAGGFNIAPPLGLHRLKNFIKGEVSACDILDFDLENEEKYLEKVARGEYDVIGMSVSHVNMIEDLEMLVKFRRVAQAGKKRVIFIAGGQEATLNYLQWLQSDLIDVIFFGFAERSLKKFCFNLSRSGDQAPLGEIVKDLNGVSFRSGAGEAVCIAADVLTEEEFQFLSFENAMAMDVPYSTYWDKIIAERTEIDTNTEFTVRTVRLYTGSHCPRKCGFCSSQSFIRASQKNASPIFAITAEQIFELVKRHVRHYGAEGFLFSDDDFPIGTPEGINRIESFCHLIIGAKREKILPDRIKFFCQSRVADYLDHGKLRHDLIRLMKRAGFDNTGLGIETLCDRLLKAPSVNKLGVTVSDCKRVIDGLLGEGITPIVFIIIGIPESTVDELAETLCGAADYIRKGVDVSVTAQLRVNPGSPLCERNDLPQKCTPWVNPFSGGTLSVAKHFIPSDPAIQMIVDNIQQKTDEEMQVLCSQYGWTKNIMIPKTIIGIATFIAAAKLIHRQDIAEKFFGLVRDMVHARTDLPKGNE